MQAAELEHLLKVQRDSLSLRINTINSNSNSNSNSSSGGGAVNTANSRGRSYDLKASGENILHLLLTPSYSLFIILTSRVIPLTFYLVSTLQTL